MRAGFASARRRAYGECICGHCLAVETELDCDALDDDDYVLNVRGCSQIIVHDDGVDASEIITAAAGLVPRLAIRPTSSQFGSAGVASHRTDDDRRVETREQPGILSGAKFFGVANHAESDPWPPDCHPWTVVQRKKGVNFAAPTGSASTLPTAPSATPSPILSSSPAAVGPIFPPLILSTTIPSIPTSGVTSLTYIKGAPTTMIKKEAETKVEMSVPPLLPLQAEVRELLD